MVTTEFVTNRANAGEIMNLYYWRDKTGHEKDLVVDHNATLLPVEIKSGRMGISEFFKNFEYWNKLSQVKKSVLLYAGDMKQTRSNGVEVWPWRKYLLK